jgi:hypothetical protein
MDPIKSIGRLLKDGEGERDCVHVAIMPAIAAEDMSRGAEVGLVYGTKNQISHKHKVYGLKSIGIVDPYFGLVNSENPGYTNLIRKGQRCWVFLFPGSITGLRHQWILPAIDEVQSASNEHEEWLRQFADKWNFDYDRMIEECQSEEGYVTAMGIDLHSASELDPGDEAKFWMHVSALTGKVFDKSHRQNFGWSCSC